MAKKILIIEDDVAFYNNCAIELKLRGYSVINVSDGQLGFDKAKVEKPDLILLDIVMPGKNGLEVLQELKNDDETKAIKVIMLTNFGTDENVKRAMELGAEDYIMKYNVVPSELPNRIGPLLGEEQASNVKITNVQ